MTKKSGSFPSPKNNVNDEPVRPGLGWPGYRTRQGRTGWDPIDADNEAAHMTGTIFRRLFYGRVRNPLHLCLLGLLGLILIFPPILAAADILKGGQFAGSGWFFLLLSAVAGVAVLVNFIRNLIANLSR